MESNFLVSFASPPRTYREVTTSTGSLIEWDIALGAHELVERGARGIGHDVESRGVTSNGNAGTETAMG